MNKIFLLTFIFFVQTYANKSLWEYTHSFTLKKDQIVEMKIVKDYKKTFQYQGVLKFRWTLFHNDRLVLLLNYEGFKKQYILETRHKLNTIKLNLTDDYKRIDKRPFAIMKFISFDSGKQKVKMDFLVSDPSKRLEVKLVTPK